MRLTSLHGTIDRRLLVNFNVDLDAVRRLLPEPFEPIDVHGRAVVGVCLIRLKALRPGCVPSALGMSSENAAHRFAVRWNADGVERTGVYVPRRDTDSRLAALAGGRLFPGVQHHAAFDVREGGGTYAVSMRSDDGSVTLSVEGSDAADLPVGSVFQDVDESSEFFESGSVGYSATSAEGRFDGMELRCQSWDVTPLEVTRAESSYFDDRSKFPAGSVVFDHALLMRSIEHQWVRREDVCCA